MHAGLSRRTRKILCHNQWHGEFCEFLLIYSFDDLFSSNGKGASVYLKNLAVCVCAHDRVRVSVVWVLTPFFLI